MTKCPKCSADIKTPPPYRPGTITCSSCGTVFLPKETDKSAVLFVLALFSLSGAFAIGWPWRAGLILAAFAMYQASRRQVALSEETPEPPPTPVTRSVPEKALYFALFLVAIGIVLLPVWKLFSR